MDLAQFSKSFGVDREQAAEDDGLDFLEAGQRFRRALFDRGDGVTHPGLRRLP